MLSTVKTPAVFGTLIVPGFTLARAAFAERRRWLLPLLGAAVVVALASNKDPLGEQLYTLTLWLERGWTLAVAGLLRCVAARVWV